MLYSNLGTLKKIDGEHWIDTKKGDSGYVIYGPYVKLMPGRYAVTIRARLKSPRLKNVVCCNIDIAGAGGRIVKERSLTTAQITATKGRVDLPFVVDREDVFEFRVHATGQAALSVKAEPDLRLLVDETSDFTPILPKGERTDNQFFMTNFPKFRELHDIGFSFTVSAAEVVAHYSGLSFYIENIEDLLIINEIFLFNDYNVISRRDKLVIDIGMNSGLTSLFMANKPAVREVHAFEPFATPHRRALRNFALNPRQSAKISVNNYGLGGADEVLTVRASPSSTIGLSIRGTDVGEPEEIQVREAAGPIRSLAARAREQGLELIVKMDCEGSEFPIFDALERGDLLKEIDAIVIEWHRWWSKEKTEDDLVRALLAADFMVIDRTNPTGLYTGLIYGVKRVAS